MHQLEEVIKEVDTKPKVMHLLRSPSANHALCGVPRGTTLPGVKNMEEAISVGVSCPDCLLKAESVWRGGFEY